MPFEVIPFKANPKGTVPPPPKIHHVHCLPDRIQYEMKFPRVLKYTFVLSGRIDIDWQRVPILPLDPTKIPDDVITKGLSWTKEGRPTLYGSGKTERDTLRQWRETHRRQELECDLASVIISRFAGTEKCQITLHRLFPQVLAAVKRFADEKGDLRGSSDI